MELALGGSASVDRRAQGQQSFRIRKFSRNGSLSGRSNSMSQRGDDPMTESAQKLTDLKKTIDSEDEDGIV